MIGPAGPSAPPEPGLCGRCVHALQARTAPKVTWLIRCRRSITDPGFPQHPELPVEVCAGYEPTPIA